MAGRDSDNNEPDDQELIYLEFESMISGLSLDQSTPNTYLDELDARDDSFKAELPAQESFRETLRRARNTFKNWIAGGSNKNGDGDGAAL